MIQEEEGFGYVIPMKIRTVMTASWFFELTNTIISIVNVSEKSKVRTLFWSRFPGHHNQNLDNDEPKRLLQTENSEVQCEGNCPDILSFFSPEGVLVPVAAI